MTKRTGYGAHGNKVDEVTATTTGGARKVVVSVGRCTACPEWRGDVPLVNGLCEFHRFWRVPATEAKRQAKKKGVKGRKRK